MQKKGTTVYMMLSNDEYRLPEAFSTNAEQLAQMVGVRKNNIMCSINKGAKKGREYRFIKVVIDDDE